MRKVNCHKKKYLKVMISLVIMIITLSYVACGRQEISFGKEVFFGVEAAEEMNFTKKEERPVQIAVGERYVWILTANSRNCVYEREIDTGAVRRLEWPQGNQELIMGMSAVDDILYAGVSCGETVQVRKLLEDGRWENIISIPREEAPEQVQPAVFFIDRAENAYFSSESELCKYSSEGGEKTVYKLEEPTVFLQEKKPGEVEALSNSGRKIASYTLKEDGKAEEKWAISLPTGHLAAVQTDSVDTLVLAVDNKILFVNNTTGEITSHFDSIAAGVSTNVLGGLWLTEEGTVYLAEQTADSGGIWEQLTAQSGPEGDRTVLVYGTVYLSETMKERIVSFNKTNPDYYVTVEEYDGNTISDRRLQMQAEVTSGKEPDILDLYSYCVENYIFYAEKGYLEDLEPYLLSEDFRDDILWPVQDLYRVKGKICMAVPHFTMWGLAVNQEYATETGDWSFKTFAETIGHAQGKKHIVAEGTAHDVLAELLQGMQGEFIDWDEKKAYFDTPEFINLLELCKEYGKKGLTKDDTWEYADEVVMISLSVFDPGQYLEVHACYGENALLYGYPAMGGQVLLVNNAVDACGICSQSKNKQGAWEFLRTLYSEDYQRQITGHTAAWAVRESCWYEMWGKYYSGMTINGVYAAPATDDEIERLADMILNGNITVDLMNGQIAGLVLEEADAYFEGDHNVEEAAGNIQDRVQLMLEE